MIRLKRSPGSPASESAPASIGHVAVHAVQKEIHHAQASRIGNQFPAANKAGLQMLFLILVHVVVFDDEIKRFQQEAAGAPLVNKTGSQTVSSGVGSTQSTIA